MPDLDEPVLVTRKAGRRRITVFVFPDNRVEVRAPGRTSVDSIFQFVASTTPWIQKRLARNRLRPAPQKLRFVEGEKIPYLGRWIELKAVSGRRIHFDEARAVLYVPVEKRSGSSEINAGREMRETVGELERTAGAANAVKVQHIFLNKAAVVRFFEKSAREVFDPLVKRYAAVIGRSASHVSVRAMKSRWGSCSSTGRLSLNWRILCAPPEVAEYLVVHEMCHLIHRNHSDRFWKAVEKAMPEFKKARAVLRKTGPGILSLWT